MLRIMRILTQPVLFRPYAGEKRRQCSLSSSHSRHFIPLLICEMSLTAHNSKKGQLARLRGKMGHAVSITGEDKNTHSCHLNIITVA